MDDLFNQLKTSSPVNKVKASKFDKKSADNHSKQCESPITVRRESLPVSSSHEVVGKKNNKSRSLSPANVAPKKCMVMLERKKLEFKSSSNSFKVPAKPTKTPTLQNSFKKSTPTKAQQKQFDPEVLKKAQQLKKSFKTKQCVVRIKRDNLLLLQKKSLKKHKTNKKKASTPSSPNVSQEKTNKRKSDTKVDSPKSAKKAKKENNKSPANKAGGFFIKLSSPSQTKRQEKSLRNSAAAAKEKTLSRKAILNSAYLHTTDTKPTKFTRTQLIRTFGKRYFTSQVRIKRSKHPLMLIFESNALARKLKAKRDKKNKNLSVSFNEQVEIFGDSDSDEYPTDTDSDYECPKQASTANKNKTAFSSENSTNAATNANTATANTAQLVTPARLKKVENGKVVDDIELDTSLFIDPATMSASTPYMSPGRKKRDKKLFSPLKEDDTPSPRKEQLKLANEKLPPSGLRRLNIDDMADEEDDDEDDEYIVPNDLPPRRGSQTSSIANAEHTVPTVDGSTVAASEIVENASTPTGADAAESTQNPPSKSAELASAYSETLTKSNLADESNEIVAESDKSSFYKEKSSDDDIKSVDSFKSATEQMTSKTDEKSSEQETKLVDEEICAKGITDVDNNLSSSDVIDEALDSSNKGVSSTEDDDGTGISLRLYVTNDEISEQESIGNIKLNDMSDEQIHEEALKLIEEVEPQVNSAMETESNSKFLSTDNGAAAIVNNI